MRRGGGEGRSAAITCRHASTRTPARDPQHNGAQQQQLLLGFTFCETRGVKKKQKNAVPPFRVNFEFAMQSTSLLTIADKGQASVRPYRPWRLHERRRRRGYMQPRTSTRVGEELCINKRKSRASLQRGQRPYHALKQYKSIHRPSSRSPCVQNACYSRYTSSLLAPRVSRRRLWQLSWGSDRHIHLFDHKPKVSSRSAERRVK